MAQNFEAILERWCDTWGRKEDETLIDWKKEMLIHGRLFALFHDSQRRNEEVDTIHGIEADLFLKDHGDELLIDFPSAYSVQVGKICRPHTDFQPTMSFLPEESESEKLLIGMCLDADRLDLIRVNIVPEKSFFFTEEGEAIRKERFP